MQSSHSASVFRIPVDCQIPLHICFCRDIFRVENAYDTPDQVDRFLVGEAHDVIFGIQGVQTVLPVFLDVCLVPHNKRADFAFLQFGGVRNPSHQHQIAVAVR